VWGQDLGELLRKSGMLSGEYIGKASLKVGKNNLRIEAEIRPATFLFGVITIPTFIYAHCYAKIYIDETLYFEHLFW